MSDGQNQSTTTAQLGWTEDGERYEARCLAARIRAFLSDARLLSSFKRREFEIAAEDLEAHAG